MGKRINKKNICIFTRNIFIILFSILVLLCFLLSVFNYELDSNLHSEAIPLKTVKQPNPIGKLANMIFIQANSYLVAPN